MIEVMIKYDNDEAPIIEEFADMGHLVRALKRVDNAVWFEFLDSEDQHTYDAYIEFCDELSEQCAS